MTFGEVSVNVCLGFGCCSLFGFYFFFPFGTCLETGFRTRGSLGFYLLFYFSV